MSQQERTTRRRLYPILGLLGLLIGLLLLLAQGAYADFPHTTDVLLSSSYAACNAVRPHLARSETGEWIAVSWIQENPKQGGGCFANGGRALLRWATEGETYSGWQGPLALESPETGGCINHVDVAVRGTTAHVVLTSQSPCENTSKSAVHYTTCNLTTGSCQGLSESTEIVAINNPGTGVRFLEAYIAVDDANRPHIVYSRRDVLMVVNDWERPSQIFYARRNTSGVWKTRGLSDATGAYEPRIAWDHSTIDNEGYVHIVWEVHLAPQSYGGVAYRRCDDDVYGASGQIDCSGNPYDSRLTVDGTYPRPAVGVSGDRVTLIWNHCVDIDVNAPCEKFSLLYRRSDVTGWGFSAQSSKEVRTNRDVNSPLHKYDGTDDDAQEYMYLPRAAAEMNAAGSPVVAWQIQDPALDHVYTLSTTWAISASTHTFNWEETVWSSGEGYDTRISPDIALPDPSRESQGLHLVFMRRQGLYDKYLVYYSYFGTELYETPTPSPTPRGEDMLKVYLPLICRGR